MYYALLSAMASANNRQTVHSDESVEYKENIKHNDLNDIITADYR